MKKLLPLSRRLRISLWLGEKIRCGDLRLIYPIISFTLFGSAARSLLDQLYRWVRSGITGGVQEKGGMMGIGEVFSFAALSRPITRLDKPQNAALLFPVQWEPSVPH